jgi:hypothetical protein
MRACAPVDKWISAENRRAKESATRSVQMDDSQMQLLQNLSQKKPDGGG